MEIDTKEVIKMLGRAVGTHDATGSRKGFCTYSSKS